MSSCNSRPFFLALSTCVLLCTVETSSVCMYAVHLLPSLLPSLPPWWVKVRSAPRAPGFYLQMENGHGNGGTKTPRLEDSLGEQSFPFLSLFHPPLSLLPICPSPSFQPLCLSVFLSVCLSLTHHTTNHPLSFYRPPLHIPFIFLFFLLPLTPSLTYFLICTYVLYLPYSSSSSSSPPPPSSSFFLVLLSLAASFCLSERD